MILLPSIIDFRTSGLVVFYDSTTNKENAASKITDAAVLDFVRQSIRIGEHEFLINNLVKFTTNSGNTMVFFPPDPADDVAIAEALQAIFIEVLKRLKACCECASSSPGGSGQGGLAFLNAAPTSGDTIEDTVVETDFESKYALPANPVLNCLILQRSAGIYKTEAIAPTIRIRFKLKGSTSGTTYVLVDSTAFTVPVANPDPKEWVLDVSLVFTAVGVAGSVEVFGNLKMADTVIDVFDILPANALAISGIDTTEQLELQTTVEWGTAHVDNSITQRIVTTFQYNIITVTPLAPGTAIWGAITGVLSDQTDLQTALDAKVDENAPIVPGTFTKITYDAKGLVTAGAAATAADVGADPAGSAAAALVSANAYTDSAITGALEGLIWKSPAARAATTANIVLSGPQVIDGISVIAGDTVLVKDQTLPEENGIYVVDAAAWIRRSDADTGAKLQNAVISVNEGTANADTSWRQATDGVVIGVDPIVWDALSSSVPDATPLIKGKMKLYITTGANTDGTMDQNSITTALNLKENLANKTDTPTADVNSGDTDEYPSAEGLSEYVGKGSWKISVRAATTGDITLSAPQSIDGVSVIAGEFVLVKNQTVSTDNGIYTVRAGAWTRRRDADDGVKLERAVVSVSEGTVNINTTWQQITPNATIGVSNILWEAFATGGSTNVQIFGAGGGTWTKPTGAKYVKYVVIGAGGGGGGGSKSPAATNSAGGAGGGGGGISDFETDAALLPATVAVTVATGGAGGAAQTVNSTNGNPGGAGSGISAFGQYLKANNAAGGGGGVNGSTSVAGASAGSGLRSNGGAGGGGISAGGGNSAPANYGPAGGGGGGGVTAGGGQSVGGSGNIQQTFSNASALPNNRGNLVTRDAGNGDTGSGFLGYGGGGGGASNVAATNAGNGGNGSAFGAGGGGGGTANDAAGNSGAGGHGADGAVIVITFF